MYLDEFGNKWASYEDYTFYREKIKDEDYVKLYKDIIKDMIGKNKKEIIIIDKKEKYTGLEERGC